MTYSINVGLKTESSSYPLHIKSNFDDILFKFLDNESKLINPIDIRNALLSLWTSVPFKETNNFIGLDDTLDITNPTTTKTIFLGKRSFSTTNTYLPSDDIMNSTLLGSDTDIFLFNTKSDTLSNTVTKVSILAGNDFNKHVISPFIQSSLVEDVTQSLSIDFVSIIGDTTINSERFNSKLLINKIHLPKIEESYSNASDSKTLVWRGTSSLSWEQLSLPQTDTIGTQSAELNIYGEPVNINGYSLELSDDRYMPISVGGIPMGSSFNNYPIVEVLRRIIYPYLAPQCSISVLNNFFEIGTAPDIVVNYSVTKRTKNTQSANLINIIPSSLYPIIDTNHKTINGSGIGIIPNGGIIDEDVNTFTINVSDGVDTSSDSTFIKGILPYYYGITSDIINSTGLLNLQKLVEEKSDKEVYLQGNSNVYFIYDNNYPELTQIIDENENDITNQFTLSIKTFTSPQSYWINRKFKVYKRNLIIPVGPPNAKYSFRY